MSEDGQNTLLTLSSILLDICWKFSQDNCKKKKNRYERKQKILNNYLLECYTNYTNNKTLFGLH